MSKIMRNLASKWAWRSVSLAPALFFVICFFLAPGYTSAQTTAQISGEVTDATGALVAGAKVTLTNTDTNAVRTAQTADDGTYTFPALPVGPYKLEVSKEGFQSFVQSGIVLQVNTNPAINVTLQIGSVSQTVEVQANASMVETQSTGVGQVIQPEQVVDLPLNGRQATQLIALSGAAVNTAGAGGLASNLDYPSAVTFSVAGSSGNATNYYLDGSSNVDYRTNVGEPMPFPDALQEFKVESSALPANLGNRPGGTVSGITKSGTNQFHGDVFEFLRNGAMDAAFYNFGSGKPTYDNLKRNQFGGVIGGPIVRDKLFFFYGVQETTERQQSAPTTRTVPTTAMLQGDFSACSTINLHATVPAPIGGTGSQPFSSDGKHILPAWFNTPSAKIANSLAKNLWGIGTTLNPSACGSVQTSGYQHDNEFQHVVRTDWQRTNNDTIFARYYITNYNLLSSVAGPANILNSSGVGLADRVQNVSVGDTHIITPQMLSSFRVYYERTATQRTPNNAIPNVCTLGMINADCPTPHIVNVLVNAPGFQGWDYENAFGISENIGWQIRSHHLEFGFAGVHIQMNGDGTFQLNPSPAFASGGSSYTGSNIAGFVAGIPDTLGQGNGQLSRDGQNLPSLYFQDNWKMTRRFQMNLGIRWDPYFPQHNKYGQASDFSLGAYQAGTQSKMFLNAPPGVTFPGDAGFNGKSDTLNRAMDFSPRIGIVWDPRGKGLETIRAGYGMFYDTSLMWNAMHIVLNPPWGNTVNFTVSTPDVNQTNAALTGGLANPYFGQPGGNPFPTPFNPPANYPFVSNGAFVFQQQDLKPSNAQLWNFSIQKQVGANWLVTASYLGSKTSHIWLGNNLNPDVIITAGMTGAGIVSTAGMTGTNGPCTLAYNGQNVTYPTCNSNGTVSVSGVNNESARKLLNLINPNQAYKMNGGLIMAQSMGNAAYNGLLLSVQHRLSHGFSINGNYTWSHCLDDGELGQDIGANFQNPADPKADWGNCASDRRSIFNLSLVAQTPKFNSAMLQRIVGTWTGSGIFTASTGSYVNVLDGADISLVGNGGVPGTAGGNDRPNQVGDPFTAGSVSANPGCTAPTKVKTLSAWFNKCAFQNQPAKTFGNTARNSLLGPGRWNFDAALWRTFPVTEQVKIDFRFEGFNLFNHPQFGNPNATISGSTVGTITSASPQRILQAALKVTF